MPSVCELSFSNHKGLREEQRLTVVAVLVLVAADGSIWLHLQVETLFTEETRHNPLQLRLWNITQRQHVINANTHTHTHKLTSGGTTSFRLTHRNTQGITQRARPSTEYVQSTKYVILKTESVYLHLNTHDNKLLFWS